jgi:hypothetical protein
MLFFRSEEHARNWCDQWKLHLGAIMTMEQGWELAKAWYMPDRRNPDWRRYTPGEAQEIFRNIGLTSPFWKIT